jgi:FkbM family methyltransferase
MSNRGLSPQAFLRTVSGVLRHPSGVGARRIAVFCRFVAWQLNKRTIRVPVVVRRFQRRVRVRAYPDSAAASGVIYFDYPDWLEMKLLEKLLRPGDAFADVGANIGVYSLLAYGRVGRAGTIAAFEPSALAAARLEENFGLNGMDTSHVYVSAVGDHEGRVAFVADDCTGAVLENASSHVARDVPLVSLDSVLFGIAPFWAAIKIDVEGYELSVVRGAPKLLERGVGLVVIETNALASRHERLELQRLLGDAGYQLYSLRDDRPTFERLSDGSPLPHNSIAIADPSWVRARIRTAVFVDET